MSYASDQSPPEHRVQHQAPPNPDRANRDHPGQARWIPARREEVGRVVYEWRLWISAIHLRLNLAASLARLLPDFALVGLRTQCYRWAGCDIQRGASLQGRITLLGTGPIARRLHIAEGAIIAPNVSFGLDGDITIGKNASVAPWSIIHTATHPLGFGSRRMTFQMVPHSVTIGEGAWVGMAAVILPGVTIGPGSVVAAGSVVMDDVEPHTHVCGNPATPSGTLPFADR